VVGADEDTVSQKDGTEFLEAENDNEQLFLGDGVEQFWTPQDSTRESKDSVKTIIQELIAFDAEGDAGTVRLEEESLRKRKAVYGVLDGLNGICQ
jgi:hypothetical protein